MALDARMNAAMYPEADHNATNRLTTTITPAEPLLF
jgi:hypothetical protein